VSYITCPLTKQTILLIAGPKHFNDRIKICDELVDRIIEVSPTKIITTDTYFDDIVAELIFHNRSIEYIRHYNQRDKYGKHADSRRNYEMSYATHALIFNDESMEMVNILYFANRHRLNIKLINLK